MLMKQLKRFWKFLNQPLWEEWSVLTPDDLDELHELFILGYQSLSY